jgi:hypothetical protein
MMMVFPAAQLRSTRYEQAHVRALRQQAFSLSSSSSSSSSSTMVTTTRNMSSVINNNNNNSINTSINIKTTSDDNSNNNNNNNNSTMNNNNNNNNNTMNNKTNGINININSNNGNFRMIEKIQFQFIDSLLSVKYSSDAMGCSLFTTINNSGGGDEHTSTSTSSTSTSTSTSTIPTTTTTTTIVVPHDIIERLRQSLLTIMIFECTNEYEKQYVVPNLVANAIFYYYNDSCVALKLQTPEDVQKILTGIRPGGNLKIWIETRVTVPIAQPVSTYDHKLQRYSNDRRSYHTATNGNGNGDRCLRRRPPGIPTPILPSLSLSSSSSNDDGDDGDDNDDDVIGPCDCNYDRDSSSSGQYYWNTFGYCGYGRGRGGKGNNTTATSPTTLSSCSTTTTTTSSVSSSSNNTLISDDIVMDVNDEGEDKDNQDVRFLLSLAGCIEDDDQDGGYDYHFNGEAHSGLLPGLSICDDDNKDHDHTNKDHSAHDCNDNGQSPSSSSLFSSSLDTKEMNTNSNNDSSAVDTTMTTTITQQYLMPSFFDATSTTTITTNISSSYVNSNSNSNSKPFALEFSSSLLQGPEREMVTILESVLDNFIVPDDNKDEDHDVNDDTNHDHVIANANANTDHGEGDGDESNDDDENRRKRRRYQQLIAMDWKETTALFTEPNLIL